MLFQGYIASLFNSIVLVETSSFSRSESKNNSAFLTHLSSALPYSLTSGRSSNLSGLIQSLKSLGEDSGIAITVASYLTPNGNNIQGQGMAPDKLLDLPDASEYGSADDKWVRNAELFIESLLEKEKLSFQTSELSNEGIQP